MSTSPSSEPTTGTSGLPGVPDAIRSLLLAVGEDPDREGLLKTPDRVSRAWEDMTEGYRTDPHSLCEHHLRPFFGKCHVAYLPNRRIVGLSKLARVVEVFSRRLQVQERLTSQVAEVIQDVLEPHGVGVVIEARHLCMMMRGVEKQNSVAVTSCLTGSFQEDPRTRAEFMELVGRDHSL